jgi:hypothetical protein
MKTLRLLCLMAYAFTAAALCEDKLPEGPGLSATYPGDAGIDKDPAVLFSDNFESGDFKKWAESSGNITIHEDKPNNGSKCVQSEMIRGKNEGGEAKKWFMPGADQVFARVYVKFSADYQYVHHFIWMSANQKKNKWSSFGKAGLKPNGLTHFSTGMEPWFAWGKNEPPGELNLYTYYMDMDVDKKMNKYWGNGFFPNGPGKGQQAGPDKVIPKLDTWQCWEFMIKANTPGKADGEQAMWLDGKLAGHFTGIRWRDDADLRINCFWLEHYGFDPGDPTKQYWKDKQTVWFDDVVISTKYIGPIKR